MSLLAGTTARTAVLKSVPARNGFLAQKHKGCQPKPRARCASCRRRGQDRSPCVGLATRWLGHPWEKARRFCSPRRENARYCLLDTVCQAPLSLSVGGLSCGQPRAPSSRRAAPSLPPSPGLGSGGCGEGDARPGWQASPRRTSLCKEIFRAGLNGVGENIFGTGATNGFLIKTNPFILRSEAVSLNMFGLCLCVSEAIGLPGSAN